VKKLLTHSLDRSTSARSTDSKMHAKNRNCDAFAFGGSLVRVEVMTMTDDVFMLCWFQNEKKQILKTNVWLRLVGIFDTASCLSLEIEINKISQFTVTSEFLSLTCKFLLTYC